MKIACIIPIFNFADSKTIERNHEISLQKATDESGVDVIESRAVLPKRASRHPGAFITDNILWHKEGLINAAASIIVHKYPIIVWVDSGVYLTAGWADRLRQAIQDGRGILQLYDRGVWLDKTGFVEGRRFGYLHDLSTVPRKTFNGMLKPSVGAAWAVTSDVWRSLGGLYPFAIVGGGDSITIQVLIKRQTPEALIMSNLGKQKQLAESWIRLAWQNVHAECGYIAGQYTHLWHTSLTSRRHNKRHKMLIRHGYDPRIHVATDPNGLLGWTAAAPQNLKRAVADFILARSVF